MLLWVAFRWTRNVIGGECFPHLKCSKMVTTIILDLCKGLGHYVIKIILSIFGNNCLFCQNLSYVASGYELIQMQSVSIISKFAHTYIFWDFLFLF